MVAAAIVYYRKYLAKHLHVESISQSSPLPNANTLFDDKGAMKYPLDATDNTSEIIGLPPNTVLLAEINSMKHEMAEINAGLKSSFRVYADQIA